MTTINLIEKDILTHLFKSSKGLEAFTLFKKSKISFSIFTRNLLTLEQKKLISEINDEFYNITQDGISLLSLISPIGKEPSWKKIPEKYSNQAISVDSFYIPSLRLLDNDTFVTE